MCYKEFTEQKQLLEQKQLYTIFKLLVSHRHSFCIFPLPLPIVSLLNLMYRGGVSSTRYNKVHDTSTVRREQEEPVKGMNFFFVLRFLEDLSDYYKP